MIRSDLPNRSDDPITRDPSEKGIPSSLASTFRAAPCRFVSLSEASSPCRFGCGGAAKQLLKKKKKTFSKKRKSFSFREKKVSTARASRAEGDPHAIGCSIDCASKKRERRSKSHPHSHSHSHSRLQ